MGATSGIGLAVAKRLSAEGWQLGIAGRRMDRLIEMQRKDLNVVAIQQIDVTREEASQQLLTLVGKMGGDIDLYFHSSGIGYQNPELDLDKELRTVETNAVGFTRMVATMFNYYAERPEREAQIAVRQPLSGMPRPTETHQRAQTSDHHRYPSGLCQDTITQRRR